MLIRVIVCGEKNTGKSELIKYLTCNYSDNYFAPPEEYKIKTTSTDTIRYYEVHGFTNIETKFRNVDCLIFMYDTGDPSTLENLDAIKKFKNHVLVIGVVISGVKPIFEVLDKALKTCVERGYNHVTADTRKHSSLIVVDQLLEDIFILSTKKSKCAFCCIS